MQERDILLKIKEIAKAKNFKTELDESVLQKPFRELKIDSLDMFSVIVSLEKEFDIMFEDEKLMQLNNLAELIAEVKHLISQKGV
ncbi:phosphopantetheine-binding protein [Mycoplasmoides pneumoniae]|uniref:Acyl carrier protein homolog n=3 Tax=Mycoplasmoides pneumoniae TaxID=2104 RepID=ACPH_MYCPN|nr:phosphopantetheine-binding protein [Mycoplasmoides pneumoniae]P75378.1 RecName: Full=Acyl carrier protein homolog; Short=ACP [Mycoplasmoides pneumoniae M129]AAB96080.1 acyl carrier protein-like protein [Mycoplasmoides pneumoniae M129]ADK86736.1 acyl carrier protein [Mycoplasmoides pneumoniae FH]APL99043.1 acyl carrier protein [Mycoplasmoides pneumoniae]ARI12037.1 acyl carrier protein [Mycoplasmoides pneumoniae]ARI12746.1 acyl carrier protein [Mycoplasmoides pneumoniae]